MPSANTNPSIIAYRPQIDGLRFFAVFVVLFYHYLPFLRPLDAFADISVLLAFFFVLSSYLITSILLTGKERTLTTNLTRSDVGIAFLVRRTLRIFPAYYVYLAMLFFLPGTKEHIQEHAGTFYAYTANFMMYNVQEYGEVTGHLWTLSVEEQFYLLWPWVILFTPGKYMRSVLGFLILAGIGSRVVMNIMGDPEAHVSPNVLTPTCLDSFALGAMLALDHKEGRNHIKIYKTLLLVMLPIWMLSLYTHTTIVNVILQRLVVSFAAIVVIHGANIGFKNWLGRFLECKPVLFLAKISYGIYLYHLLAAYLYWIIVGRLGATLQSRLGIDQNDFFDLARIPLLTLLSYFALSILMAIASWYFVEKPMNSLKRFFNFSAAAKRKEKKVTVVVEQQTA